MSFCLVSSLPHQVSPLFFNFLLIPFLTIIGKIARSGFIWYLSSPSTTPAFQTHHQRQLARRIWGTKWFSLIRFHFSLEIFTLWKHRHAFEDSEYFLGYYCSGDQFFNQFRDISEFNKDPMTRLFEIDVYPGSCQRSNRKSNSFSKERCMSRALLEEGVPMGGARGWKENMWR